MFSDAAALALSLFAAAVARRSPTPKRSYGYYRTEILAAMINGVALFVIALYILFEAYGRIRTEPAIKSGLMLIVAVGGLCINLASLWILSSGRRDNLNVRGAFLHVMTDTLGSIGAIASALLIGAFGWKWADPVASILIAILIVASAWPVLREAISIIMESAPKDVNVYEVQKAIAETNGVVDVHDLHIWSITSGKTCLSAHVVIGNDGDQQVTLIALKDLLRERFAIRHVTIQIEQIDLDKHPSRRSCLGCEI
jgi:cobalt-zinc-cadmium efflux system protein